MDRIISLPQHDAGFSVSKIRGQAPSIAGNVAHALDRMDPDFPRILAGLFGSAPPIIVAYGIHVYGRAMTSGVSRHVLVDDPDKIHFGLTHLGGDDVARSRGRGGQRASNVRTRERAGMHTTERQTAEATARPPAREARDATVHPPAHGAAHAVHVNSDRYPRDSERQRAFEVWGELFTGHPVNAKEVLRAAQVTKNESTVRRWCRAWESEVAEDSAMHQTTPSPVQQPA